MRTEFELLGHDAVSCDLLPSRRHGKHMQMDVMEAVEIGGNIAILHPDCTFVTVSGNRWHAGTDARLRAVEWIVNLWNKALHYFDRVALENPRGVLSSMWKKPTQEIQPWEFGHGKVKATCLWLYNLPPLVPTRRVGGRQAKVHRMAPGPNRKRDRSVTYRGIARAMAQQWGGLEG